MKELTDFEALCHKLVNSCKESPLTTEKKCGALFACLYELMVPASTSGQRAKTRDEWLKELGAQLLSAPLSSGKSPS